MKNSTASPAPCGDGRRSTRQRALLGATIIYGPEMLTLDCRIRDWSEDGVRIETSPTVILPERFWFIEHRIKFAHEAKLAWRRGEQAGLELLARRSLDPATDRNLRILRRIWLEKGQRTGGDDASGSPAPAGDV